MTPTPSAAQQWSGLSSAASNGQLYIAPTALSDLVHAANDARIQVNSVKKELHLVSKLAAFAKVLPSAAALAAQFSAKGDELRGILTAHEGILDDIGTTFMQAGSHYKGNDSLSKSDLAALRTSINDSKSKTHGLSAHEGPAGMRKGGGADPNNEHPDAIIPGLLAPKNAAPIDGGSRYSVPYFPQGRNDGRDSGNWGLPAALVQAEKSSFDGGKVHAEDPGGYTYEQFVDIRDSILQANTPKAVAQAATDWRWLARNLNTAFGDLNNKVVASKQHWTSPGGGSGGADRAQSAMGSYKDGNDTLVLRMNLIGEALEYASEWLYSTGWDLQQALVVNGASPYVVTVTQAQKDEMTKAAAGVMRMIYVPGVNATTGAIAQLPDPKPVTTGDTGGNNNNGGNNGGGGGNNGGGSGQSAGQLSSALQKLQQQNRDLQKQNDKLKDADKNGGKDQNGTQNGNNQNGSNQNSSSSSDPSSAIQSGLSAAQQALESALGSGSDSANSALSGLSGLSGLSAQDLKDAAAKKTAAAGKGGGGAGGGSGAGAAGKGAGQNLNASKLFPRASAAVPAVDLGARAGLASSASSGMPMGGMPMGGAGAGGGQQQKEHKRADYLDSVEHLEEALGDAPIVAKPVVEQ
ncbi:hypothetical protein [Nocardia sp. MW-W600-9]